MERRLSAILAADVVGYSRLMEADEAGTFGRLRALRKELFEPEIARHRGRIFKLMGDGLLAEFGSVVDAAECAILLQRAMAEHNGDVADDRRIDVRMAINLGDVIVEDEDRYGDGVNIAARLQPLAEPGGIVLSGTAYDQLKRKLEVGFEFLGERTIKNIAEPVRVYRLLIDPADAGKTFGAPRGPRRWTGRYGSPADRKGRSTKYVSAAALAALFLVLAGGLGWYAYRWGQPAGQGQGIPVIAVMPFQDLTGDRAGGDLGKGIAEAFMTDLAAFPDYEVASAATSFALAERPVREIVEATGATFVIEGSIRRTADMLKVTMQLIRGSTDRHLMIAEIQEPMTDPVSLQSAVATRLRDELGGMTGILRKEANRIALAKSPDALTEYDYYVLGHIKQFQREGTAAHDIWAKGLRRFPGSALLHCKMAFYFLVFTSDMDEVEKFVNKARELKAKSRLDEWYLHWTSAWVALNQQSDIPRALAEAQAAAALAPYETVSKMDLSEILVLAGRNEEAIAWSTYAMTHDPSPLWWFPTSILGAYKAAGRLKDLIELAERETRTHASKPWYTVLSSAYSATGEFDKAADAFEMARSLPDPAVE